MAKNKKDKPIFLIVLLVVFVGLIGSFIIYNIVTPSYNYDDEQFNHIDNWQTDLLLLGIQEEGNYLVYSYLESCGACQQIKNNVLGFAADNNEAISLYLADAAKRSLSNSRDYRPGTSTTVPTLLVMNGSNLVEEITGTQSILEALEAIEDGNYE